MKVNRPDRVSTSKVQSGRSKNAAGGAKFSIDTTQVDVPTPPATGLGPVAAVDALLAAQEARHEGQGRRSSGYLAAEGMLDLLEEIQHGLLLGRIPVERLQSLANLVAKRQGKERDPHLEQILQEIEQRAAVELAKLSR